MKKIKPITKDQIRMCNALIKCREAAGMTKSQMARAVGKLYSDIHRWETVGSFKPEVLVLYSRATERKIIIDAS